ncbi:unnamed protein product [Lymnaea stagnalis]|uniref:Uncharacterized protein n=1 Tax=Lymnaea stagnalis TaxID=6523 RepID=A0AAV2I2C5_LYMST
MDFAFSTLMNLEWLDLSRNIIVSLSDGSFSGLARLKTLNLSFNSLTMKDLTFPQGVFIPLKSLKVLRLNKNNLGIKNGTGLNYPDRALSALANLTYLSLDGIPNNTFGPGFQNMTSLRNLSLTDYLEGDCHMWSLYNTTFVNLSNLEYLHLADCFIKGLLIEPGAFSPLRKLYFLDLTHNEDIDVQHLANVFYGLKDTTTLKILKMELVVNRYSLGICLESRYINHFPQHLEEFHASENNLEAVDRQVIPMLSPSLKKLNVTGNKFVFGTYLQDLRLMANLTEIDLSGGSFTYNLPSQYPFQIPKYDATNSCSLYQKTLEDAHKNPFVFNLPPNLKSIKMNKAGLRYTLSGLRVGKNSLERLSLKGNYFPHLQGPLYGFDRLQYLDLSSSFIKRIEPDFFVTLTSLKYLTLSRNQLGNNLADDASSAKVFSPLTNLQLLNLSFNALTNLPPNIFRNLTSLRVLSLEKNSLIDFIIDLSSLKKLQYLDLKETRIASLGAETRRQIDALVQMNISVNMQRNPILCDCSNQQFLEWMTSSEAFN